MTASTIKSKPLSQAASDRSIKRIKELLQEGMSQAEMVETLNRENQKTIRLQEWNVNNLRQVIFKIRHSVKSWYCLSSRRAQLVLPALGTLQ